MNKSKHNIFRIIDANLNRSQEGLRVCEEITRFILNSQALTGELKSIRHGISRIKKELSVNSRMLLESRDAKSDVGRNIDVKECLRRVDYPDILTANLERVKESLRVLEEFCKLIDEKKSKKFLTIRFKVYDIEKRIGCSI